MPKKTTGKIRIVFIRTRNAKSRLNGSPPGYRRWRLNPAAGISDSDILGMLEKEGRGIGTFLNNLGPNAFLPYNYTQPELSIGSKLNRAPNPADIIIPWYSEVIFVLKDSHEKFNRKKPFRVVNNVRGSQSPFYKGEILSDGDRVLTVKYLSLPYKDYLEWDYIKPRKCIYYYELSLVQSYSDEAGSNFEFVIQLDPDGENDGPPGDGDNPPGWP